MDPEVPSTRLIKPKTEVLSVHSVFGTESNIANNKNTMALPCIIFFFNIYDSVRFRRFRPDLQLPAS